MKDRNELIYLIRQIIGDEKEDGFYTSVKWNNNIIEVPNFLFKDGPAEYPEIRISPFLTDSKVSHSVRVRKYDLDKKSSYYNAIFQIDIFATNIVLLNKIESAVRRRIDLFYDIDMVVYGYDKRFKLIDSEKNIYYHQIYDNNRFIITDVYFGDVHNRRVYDKEQLKLKNTYYIDETGLYINTDMPIEKVKMNSVINGFVFKDGKTAHQKGIIKTRVMNKRTLSQLENNKVERVSFELGIFYKMDQMRNPGPLATHILIE